METTNPLETPFEQFARLYGGEGHGKLLWEKWMASLPEMNRSAMERIATDQAEAHHISLEEVQARLALQKFLEDNPGFLDAYLKEQFVQSRALKPMNLNKNLNKKKKR
jgi:hypothetical protein